MSDQHHAGAMGCSGNPVVRTPHLDRLAEQGVRFTRAYCNNPICCPSRITYITGQYPHTHQIIGNNCFEHDSVNRDTLSAVFRRAGYQTAMIGKAHMIKKWDDEGFEHIRYCDLCDADRNDLMTHHYFRYMVEHGVVEHYDTRTLPPDHPVHTDGCFTSEMPLEHSIEVWTGDETLSFLKNRDENRPFFALMSFQRPHPPFAPSRPYDALYDSDDVSLPDSAEDAELGFASKPESIRKAMLRRRRPEGQTKKILAHYYGLISLIDEQIGRVIAHLREEGLLEDTVIVYTADHGDFAGDHGIVDKNIGIFESVHRIPFIISYPGAPQGEVRDAIIESVDVYPTLCELAGVAVPRKVEGTSILPIIRDGASGKVEAIAEWDRVGGKINALRTPRYRLVYHGHDAGGELYDHVRDPGEVHNRYEDPEYRDVRIELLERLLDHVSRYRTETSMAKDRELAHENRYTLRQMVQKRCIPWSELRDVVGADE